MKILVTGSEGNIGKRLVSYLREKGHDVFGVDIKQGYKDDFAVVNITNVGDLISVFERFKPTVVYHLAAMVSRVTCEQSPCITIDTNVSGTNNIIQMCSIYKCKLINFSTSEVYGNIGGLLSEDREVNPNNIYGQSKLLAEKLVEYAAKNGLNAISVRPFMFYDEHETMGEHRSAMIRFAENLLKGKKIEVHVGAHRSWLHINDGVKILEKLIYVDGYTVMNIANPDVVGVKEMAEMMCDKLGLSYDEYVNETILPDRMTLTKIPCTKRQQYYAPIEIEHPIERGIRLVLETVKDRI